MIEWVYSELDCNLLLYNTSTSAALIPSWITCTQRDEGLEHQGRQPDGHEDTSKGAVRSRNILVIAALVGVLGIRVRRVRARGLSGGGGGGARCLRSSAGRLRDRAGRGSTAIVAGPRSCVDGEVVLARVLLHLAAILLLDLQVAAGDVVLSGQSLRPQVRRQGQTAIVGLGNGDLVGSALLPLDGGQLAIVALLENTAADHKVRVGGQANVEFITMTLECQ